MEMAFPSLHDKRKEKGEANIGIVSAICFLLLKLVDVNIDINLNFNIKS